MARSLTLDSFYILTLGGADDIELFEVRTELDRLLPRRTVMLAPEQQEGRWIGNRLSEPRCLIFDEETNLRDYLNPGMNAHRTDNAPARMRSEWPHAVRFGVQGFLALMYPEDALEAVHYVTGGCLPAVPEAPWTLILVSSAGNDIKWAPDGTHRNQSLPEIHEGGAHV